jgi:hypothetical protein
MRREVIRNGLLMVVPLWLLIGACVWVVVR